MTTLNINVSNIKCGGCTSNIENGLKDLDGVDNVTAIAEGGKVTITGANLNQEAINAKLVELGFPPVNASNA